MTSSPKMLFHRPSPARFVAVLLFASAFATAFASGPGWAQSDSGDDDESVALVVELASDDAAHHAFAAGVIEGINNRWRWAVPGISPADASECDGKDTCLIALSEKVGASHLLVIATAPLDATQMVASVRAYRVRDGAEVHTSGELISLGGGARADGRELLGIPLSRARGLPQNGRSVDRPKREVVKTAAVVPGPISLAGFGVMGAGLLVGAGIAVVATVGLIDTSTNLNTELLAASAAGAVVVGLGAGVALVAVGAFVE